MADHLFRELSSLPHLTGDVIYDDRCHMTIGRRFLEARQLGIPTILVCGKKVRVSFRSFPTNLDGFLGGKLSDVA